MKKVRVPCIVSSPMIFERNVCLESNLEVIGKINTRTCFIGSSNDTQDKPSFTWDGDTSTGLFQPSLNSIGFTNNGIENMRLTNDACLGINTNDPLYNLHVQGSLFVSGYNNITPHVV